MSRPEPQRREVLSDLSESDAEAEIELLGAVADDTNGRGYR